MNELNPEYINKIEEKKKKRMTPERPLTITIGLANDIGWLVKTKFKQDSMKRTGALTEFVNDAIRTKLMLENNPKQFLIELKKRMRGLWRYVNRMNTDD
jgi:hypothetical protein